jgi:ATP-dependent RNA helicase RhlE
VARIHADRSQGQRKAALDGFKEGTHRVLVATDIAARGIDVAEIGHVVNFDLPHVPEDYVHRIGRTARMAASGRASTFASPEEMDLLRGIERLTRKTVPRADVPRDAAVFQAELKRAGEGRGHEPTPSRPRSGGGRAQGHNAARSHPRSGARPVHHASAGSHARAGSPRAHPDASGGAGAKPKLLGSWGPKRRR